MQRLLTRGATVIACALAALATIPVRPVSAGEVPLREEDVPAYPPVSARDPVVGRIEIARVGVSAAILEGVDDATIRRAVGHFPETPLPGDDGNVALAAHRTTDFYGLRHVRLGDEVTLTSKRGTFRYRVERMWVVPPEDVSVLDPAPGKVLTLVTCYPFDYQGSAPDRFIVRARAVEAALPPASPEEPARLQAPPRAAPAADAPGAHTPAPPEAAPSH